jgi:hypothetical protein
MLPGELVKMVYPADVPALNESSPVKKLLKIEPGSYYKLQANERKMVDAVTTGLLITTFDSDLTGEPVYYVALVQGELLLIPYKEGALKDAG